jgi:hypothetical protein
MAIEEPNNKRSIDFNVSNKMMKNSSAENECKYKLIET